MKKIPTVIVAALSGIAYLVLTGDPNRNSSGICAAATMAPAPATSPSPTEANAGEISPEMQQSVDQAMKLPRGTTKRFKALGEAVGDWVKKDPAGAFEWAMKQSTDNALRHDTVLTVVGLWVENDTPGAVEYITKRPKTDAWGTLAACWAARDPAAATAWATQQPKEKWPLVIGAAAEGWARKDPAPAAEWLLKLPPEQGSYGYAITAATWAWQDQSAAAAWVAKLPECDVRNDAVALLVNVWGKKTPADKEKIKDWVKQFPMPEARKEIILKQLEKPAEKK